MDKIKNHDLLREAGKMVSRCDRCGACLPVCPLFGVKGIEATSARGKNTIARALADGGIEPTREALDVVNFCLLCRACVETCPAKVPTDEAMVDVRQHLTDLDRRGGREIPADRRRPEAAGRREGRGGRAVDPAPVRSQRPVSATAWRRKSTPGPIFSPRLQGRPPSAKRRRPPRSR